MIAELIKQAFAAMDPDTGMFPQHNCKGCGKPLNADGGHPAELYAGTYTGLCYTCRDAGPYSVQEYPSGARLMSHRPHCPSYRMNRETYIYMPGCANPKCDHGRIWVYRSDGSGGSYTVNCPDCWSAHHNHPIIADLTRRQEAYHKALHTKMTELQKAWTKFCRRAGIDIYSVTAQEIGGSYRADLAEWKRDNPYPDDYDMTPSGIAG